MLSKIKRDHIKNLAFVASTCLEYHAKRNGRGHKRQFEREMKWGEMFWRDHVKIRRDQPFRCAPSLMFIQYSTRSWSALLACCLSCFSVAADQILRHQI